MPAHAHLLDRGRERGDDGLDHLLLVKEGVEGRQGHLRRQSYGVWCTHLVPGKAHKRSRVAPQGSPTLPGARSLHASTSSTLKHTTPTKHGSPPPWILINSSLCRARLATRLKPGIILLTDSCTFPYIHNNTSHSLLLLSQRFRQRQHRSNPSLLPRRGIHDSSSHTTDYSYSTPTKRH